MQIGKKFGTRGFFVEYIELDFCVKFQVNQTYGVRGVAFPKTHFQALITAPTSGWLGSYFNTFLAHSSTRKFELK